MLCYSLLLITLAIALDSAQCRVANFEPLSDEMIDYINNQANATWTAGRNDRFETLDQFTQLLGTIIPSEPDHTLPVKEFDLDGELPKEFDARQHWPKCKSIGLIRDQSACGSCWAIAAVEAMTDRICIASQAKQTPMLSTRDLLSCCLDCGDGCQGGYPTIAWLYWLQYGIVTGGLYNSSVGCQPYPFPPCSHHGGGTLPPCPRKLYPTPRCEEKCASGSGLDYDKDKHKGDSVYRVAAHQDAIKQELMKKGSLEVAFIVYADFAAYKKGIYHHVTGRRLGGHAVKLVGWGEESGVPYWILANSWNSGWGENGFFRIRRGNDECGIEDLVVGGIPRL